MPKGARNIPQIPIISAIESPLETCIRTFMFSMFLLPITFSIEPTVRNIKDFETA